MSLIQPNDFDRCKLFYPLVLTYVHQLFGLRELGIRGAFGPEPI
jgi:hypothetical protein